MSLIGIDLFAGAGGMSVGALNAGIIVKYAVEIDKHAAKTYQSNHKHVKVLNCDIRDVISFEYPFDKYDVKILFGGPPCQGFSSLNRKTRNKENKGNWLFKEFIRVAKIIRPDWIVVENVKGFIETEDGFFFESFYSDLIKLGYSINHQLLNAADYGVPQSRNRVFIIGSLHGTKFNFPMSKKDKVISVKEAISDLPYVGNGCSQFELPYSSDPLNDYQRLLRSGSQKSYNNFVTSSSQMIIDRYRYIPQGGNWEDIPAHLMKNYKDRKRCHSSIYYRLIEDNPSVVLGNFRKNMIIHPNFDRGLSVREAARIQSFPDSFKFYGSIGFQQQQVGDSVPPLLAEKIFSIIVSQSN